MKETNGTQGNFSIIERDNEGERQSVLTLFQAIIVGGSTTRAWENLKQQPRKLF